MIGVVQIHDSTLLSVGLIDSENTWSSTHAKNHFLLLKVVIIRRTVRSSSRLVRHLEVFVSIGHLIKGCVLILVVQMYIGIQVILLDQFTLHDFQTALLTLMNI